MIELIDWGGRRRAVVNAPFDAPMPFYKVAELPKRYLDAWSQIDHARTVFAVTTYKLVGFRRNNWMPVYKEMR